MKNTRILMKRYLHSPRIVDAILMYTCCEGTDNSMTGESNKSRSSGRVSSLQRVLEERVANSLFRSLLRSRFHWPVSRWLLLLSYVGRRSDRRYTFPVAYKRLDGGLVAVTPMEDSNWWKNFRTPRQCSVWLRGTKRSVTGLLVPDGERDAALVEYFRTYGILGRILGFDRNLTDSPDQLAQAKRDLAVVRFTTDEE